MPACRRRFLAGLGCALVVLLIACSRSDESVTPPADPGNAALLLLRLAREGARDPVWSKVVEEQAIASDPARFETTMTAVGKLGADCEVTHVEQLGPLDRAAVELLCKLSGSGLARVEIQAKHLADKSWRVVSIDGPGVGWPASKPRPGEGLTTSAPP